MNLLMLGQGARFFDDKDLDLSEGDGSEVSITEDAPEPTSAPKSVKTSLLFTEEDQSAGAAQVSTPAVKAPAPTTNPPAPSTPKEAKPNTKCYGTFMQMDLKNDMFLVGDIFMRKFYTVFDRDNDRIGLATAAN